MTKKVVALKNPFLTTSARCVVRQMQETGATELEYSEHSGWWLDNIKVSGSGCNHLLSMGLLREIDNGSHHGILVYRLSPEVERILAEPSYIPSLVEVLQAKEMDNEEGIPLLINHLPKEVLRNIKKHGEKLNLKFFC